MSIFGGADEIATGPTWRCPHCRTLQPETSGCWACRRSAVECGTCRFYRGAIAGDLGFCGLDRTRAPLGRDEVRPCWRLDPDPSDEPDGLFGAAELVAASGRSDVTARPPTPKSELHDPAHTSVRGELIEAPPVVPAGSTRHEAPDQDQVATDRQE